MKKEKEIIHYSGYPCVAEVSKKPKEGTYTYKKEKVTCGKCLKKI